VFGVLAATALGAYAVHSASRPKPRFVLGASPSRRTVTAGSWARYRISVIRRGFRGAINVRVTGVPRYARARLVKRGASRRMLTVATSSHTPAGRYRLVVRARGGANRSRIRLVLTIRAPRTVPIGISGTVTGLAPGTPKPVDLALRNPGARYLWVGRLTVTARSVSAPRSGPLLPCTLTDFSVRQYSGALPLALRPRTTRTLSSLGIPAAQRPQVTLLNRPLNQDGCQGATVTLAYTARGAQL
jgi:hypothetical protein